MRHRFFRKGLPLSFRLATAFFLQSDKLRSCGLRGARNPYPLVEKDAVGRLSFRVARSTVCVVVALNDAILTTIRHQAFQATDPSEGTTDT